MGELPNNIEKMLPDLQKDIERIFNWLKKTGDLPVFCFCLHLKSWFLIYSTAYFFTLFIGIPTKFSYILPQFIFIWGNNRLGLSLSLERTGSHRRLNLRTCNV